MIKIMFLKVSNEVGFSIIEFVLCDEVYIDVIVFMYFYSHFRNKVQIKLNKTSI